MSIEQIEEKLKGMLTDYAPLLNVTPETIEIEEEKKES
jgi:hypothetical protein